MWSPADQVAPCKREDNLRMEGEFTGRRTQEMEKRNCFGKEEKMKRSGDNIKLSGRDFPQRERSLWCPGDQVLPCNREDNLRLIDPGDFGQKLRKPTGEDGFFGTRDNLRPKDNTEMGDEKVRTKVDEKLRGESEFCKNGEILSWKDNMTRFAGNVSQRENVANMEGPNGKEASVPGKQQNLRVKDNLKLEGEFSQREAREWNPGERVGSFCRRDNLAMEGEFSKREDILLQDEILRRFSSKGKAISLNEGGSRAMLWDRGEMVAKVVRPDNLSLR